MTQPMKEKESQINRAVFRALATSLNLDPDSPEASRMILQSWSSRQPPQASPDENLLFYDFSPNPDAPMYTERTLTNSMTDIYRYIPCTLTLIFYGEACLFNAYMVRENLFIDGTNHPRSILRNAGIYLIPTFQSPRFICEEEGALFRRRMDLEVSAYMLVNTDSPESGALKVPVVTTSPEIVTYLKEA